MHGRGAAAFTRRAWSRLSAVSLIVVMLLPAPALARAGADPPSDIADEASGLTFSGMNPIVPARLLDTRDGTGTGVAAPVGSGARIDLVVVGRGGVPATGVDAVALNMTVTQPTAASFITVWPTGDGRPLASSLNMVAGQTVANLVFAKVGTDGKVSIYNKFGATHVVADVVGWSGDTTSLRSLVPTRVLDTRDGTGVPAGTVGPEQSIRLTVTGRAGIPDFGVDSVILNVTVTAPTAASYVTVWPTGEPRPLASSLNMKPGETNPNLVVSRVGSEGTISLYNAAGATHLVADIVGWIPSGGAYTGVNPTRVLDTRDGTGIYGSFIFSEFAGWILRPGQLDGLRGIGPGEVIELQVTEQLDLPRSASAVMLNLTATAPTEATHVTAWGYGTPQPLASSLNLAAGMTRPNLVLAEIGEDGFVSLANFAGRVHLVADVVGYFETRNTADAVDEVLGPQVHVLHVIPKGSTPTYGDAEILHTLTVADDWLTTAGGRGYRFDTAGGEPEITRLYLDKSATEIRDDKAHDRPPGNYDNWDDWLLAAGFGVGNKIYIAFIDGVDTGSQCGIGGMPHARLFTSACAPDYTGMRPNTTGTWQTLRAARVLVHEVLHVLGAVNDCAPGHSWGHHAEDPADVMYAYDMVINGELAPGHATHLDPGRDDYWEQGNSDCGVGRPWPDVSLSPYLVRR